MPRIYQFSFCLFFLIIGCKKQEIQLPLIDIQGLSEIQNHSSIWIFYQEDQHGANSKLNKNNKIINTHWIFNIDRRLSMREVIPHLTAMQKNKNKDSMHKKEGMLNYFSYADTATEKISLCLFRQTTFINISADERYFMKRKAGAQPEIQLSNDQIYLNDQSIELSDLKSKLVNMQESDENSGITIQLFIEEETSYQDYLLVKVFLNAHDFMTHSTEYLIN